MNYKVNNVTYNIKDKIIYIQIANEKLLEIADIKLIENDLQEKLQLDNQYKIVLDFIYQNNNIDNIEETLLAYYSYIVSKNQNLKMLFDNKKAHVVDDRLFIKANFNYEKTLLEKNIPLLKEQFNKMGIKDINIEIEVSENEEKKKEVEESIKELEQKAIANNKAKSSNQKREKVLFGEASGGKIFPIKEIINPDLMLRNVTIEGVVFNKELRTLKNSSLLTIMITDGTGTIIAKTFTGFGNQKPTYDDLDQIKIGMKVQISGQKNYDKFVQDEVVDINSMKILDGHVAITDREDAEEEKRLELHLHGKMSKNNGVSSIDQYAQVAQKFGHAALAITDHHGVQGFVDLERASKKYNLKAIYGIEASIVDVPLVVRNATDVNLLDETYTIFDLETTGLSANFNKIIEIGAVKIKNGEIIDRFQTFVKIDQKLSSFTTELTGITDQDVAGGIDLKEALENFRNFYEGTTLVAHNATFDYQFLNKNEKEVLGKSIDAPTLDTLELSRILNPENTFHSLKILSRKYSVPMDHNSHHRADYDSEKLSEIFILMLKQIKDDYPQFVTLADLNKTDVNKSRGYHELIYVKNQDGLVDLYELISKSNTEDYLMEPRIRRNYLDEKRTNLLIVGSGCAKSKLIDVYLNQDDTVLEELISYYDYIDINPIKQYSELINNDTFESLEDVKKMHKKIIEIANKVNTKVFASSNAHFINPELAIVKEILLAKDFKPEKIKKDKVTGQEVFVDKIKFSELIADKKDKFASQYYHTTEEMLSEFSFLGDEVAKEVVIDNTHLLADEIEVVKIIPDDLFTPTIEGVDEKLTDMVMTRARQIYGEEIPEIVQKRIDKELNSIIKYGFSVIYYISHKLVKHSLDNGYLVGSRGSVGSSIVATFMDITEINPLPAHYVCSKCQRFEFFTNGEYASGFDLPDKNCPDCDIKYIKDGQDIPFETFLGFEGDKVPDIDLNFSGEFQAEAHDFVRSRDKLNDPELFDSTHAYRAGTIGTIAEKTAFAYTRNYFELLGQKTRKSDILLYSQECEGIKRTTGQHPGGIIVVPEELEIYEFTPVQYPADDKKQPWQTTHFDFHSIHDNLLKLDILGHDDPTMLKRLYDMTGVDPKHVDVSDEKILQLFTSTKSLNIEENDVFELGTQGIPEFGTDFVISMLKDTKPKTFSELVQISGLSHGTDVWIGNAKELIDNNIADISQVIGCRDDIMVYLMYQGLDASNAFSIMENVRKGKGLSPDDIRLMKDNNVPDWYIDSCQKIKYMFPKAHAAAYVLMALRIAYYKVYYPLEYYCAYFSSRVSDFDPVAMIKGEDYLMQRIEDLQLHDHETSEVKKKSLLNSLKMSLEMAKRGYKFIGFDLNKSESFQFVIDKEENGLIMPFGIIDGLGEKEAISIVEERAITPFQTKEDLKKRTKIKNKSLDQLEYFNVLEGLEESNQLSLF